MPVDLSQRERQLLNRLQDDFPLVSRPFATLADELDWSEQGVMRAVARVKDDGLLRRICAIFDTRRLGYQSTLVAARVQPAMLDEVAARVSEHPGVSHNYGRDHAYNLWFTLAVPPKADLAEEAGKLLSHPGVSRHLLLPRVRTFKLHVRFDMTGNGSHAAPSPAKDASEGTPFDMQDVPLVRLLQQDLPLVERPFHALAERSSYTEEALLTAARRFERDGIMRRYSALLRHHRAGYRSNAMACWEVAPERIVTAGEAAAAHPAVSHCYQRSAHPPDWPYQLFTMAHARSDAELESVVQALYEIIRPQRHAVLRSTHQYKKVRLRYFSE